ncbi:MAG TPA: hypothetical protein VOB72_24325 [Candidatus Dormibacteraeota bacterium]|nr:hypothetical protein [Candidatus Dormibacteraeota bacterium]
MSVRLAAASALAGLTLAACATAGGNPLGARSSPRATEERSPVATVTPATPNPTPRGSATPRSTPAQPGAPTLVPAPEPATAVDLTFSGSVTGRVRTANASNPCGKAIVGGFAAVLNLSLSGQPSVLDIELLDYHGPGAYVVPPERVSLRVGPPGTSSLLIAQKGSVSVDASERGGRIDTTMSDGSTRVVGAFACT